MFKNVTLHGGSASLLWGYRTAVVLRTWTIQKLEKSDGAWRLSATIERIDSFQARQRPLLFTAPRPGGFWAWPLIDLQLNDKQLTATLGPPER